MYLEETPSYSETSLRRTNERLVKYLQRKTKMEVRRKERNGSVRLERRGSSKQKLIDTVDPIDDWPTLRYNGTRVMNQFPDN